MQIRKPMKLIKSSALALLLAFVLSSCATKMTFKNSSIVPAATGEVKVKKDKNNNYDLTVGVTNLAEPEKLSPSRSVYVVWMESDRNELKKLGQIKVSTGTFNKALRGELNTTTTTKPDKVFITAERDADGQTPNGETVLTTR